MARWTDIAPRQENTVNQGGKMSEVRGLVVHIAEGTYEGTISWQKNPSAQVSSHFIVSKSGAICQMVDTATVAWTQADGNGHWISVENEGHSGEKLTDAQLQANAKIFAKVCSVYKTPLQVTSSVSGYGLGHHAMGGNAWGGHPNCPGTPIINQKPEIVTLAQGGGMTTKEYADATWNDDIIPTAPSRDDATTNTTTAAKNTLSSIWELQYNQIDQLKEIQAAVTAETDVTLSDAQLDALAVKVANHLHGLTFLATPPA